MNPIAVQTSNDRIYSKVPTVTNTLTRPSADASPSGGAPTRLPGSGARFDQSPSPTVNATMTMVASASSVECRHDPEHSLALSLRPAMFTRAKPQMAATAMARSDPGAAGHSTTKYCDAPVVSAAETAERTSYTRQETP